MSEEAIVMHQVSAGWFRGLVRIVEIKQKLAHSDYCWGTYNTERDLLCARNDIGAQEQYGFATINSV